MNDDQSTPLSGSRWEPEPGTSAEETIARPVRRGPRRAAGFALGSAAGNDDDTTQTGVVLDPDGDGDGTT